MSLVDVPGDASPAIKFEHIDKRFGAVHANRDVTLSIARGTIHAIVGENGAGKSTLVSILYGFYQADFGHISIHGQRRTITSPHDAMRAGIGMVHQHFMLVETLSVADNLLLGLEGGPWLSGGRKALALHLDRLARDYDLKMDPDRLVGDLPIGLQQRVELLKSLVRDADILILDEPTAVLTPGETEHFFALLRDLKARGKTILLITHKLREVMAVADHVSVMRQGQLISTAPIHATSEGALAEAMVGRLVDLPRRTKKHHIGAPVLSVESLVIADPQNRPVVRDVSFQLRSGEILGIAGVSGNGQSDMLEALAGLRAIAQGRITIADYHLEGRGADIAHLHKLGVRHIPEDRLRYALVPDFPAWESALIGADAQEGAFIAHAQAQERTRQLMQAYDVRPPDPYWRSGSFSGGNQQKLVLARELDQKPRILLVGQPTRGVDIGAIALIHEKLLALSAQGVAIILVSAEIDEVLRLCDRILVMHQGRIMGERRSNETDERDLGLLMAGIA